MGIWRSEPSFSFRINRAKLRDTYRREGRYLLRSNLSEQAPATLWEYYTQLTEVEEAFKNLKGDLGIRPIFPSASPSHRSTHLYRLCELLSSYHSAPALARLGARINSPSSP